jgi:Na+/proline symporter
MIRFMSLDSAASTNRARVYYYAWYVVFYLVANSVGLLSRLLIPETEAFDPELALPTLAVQLLPPVLVGVVLAGVFAATISTGDSLVLACSAAVTEDAMGKTQKLWQVKMATVSVVALALGIALAGPQNVFDLVVVSWGVLGASFAPLLLVYVVGYRPSEGLAIAMVIAALVAVYGWTRISLLAEYYEGMFGIIVALAVFALGRMFGFCGSRQRY